jgi:3-methylfumaryl-CoA hydratase
MTENILASSIKSNEICSLSMVRRVAAMLDLETSSFSEGDILPKGWHFFMLAGQTRTSELRKDGFPGLGVPMPDLGNLTRLLLGGRTVSYKGDILIGSIVEKTSFIKNIVEKTTKNGPMAIVTIQHELRPVLHASPAIVETQTYILKPIMNYELGIRKEDPEITNHSQNQFPIPNSHTPNAVIIPDETLLFQYSALGFNSHKIHLDRDYARNIEGLPDLVVNGGLATLLATEYLRNIKKVDLTEMKVKHLAPLYCNRPLTIVSEENELKIYNENNELAVQYDINEEIRIDL